MKHKLIIATLLSGSILSAAAQKAQPVSVVKSPTENKVDILIGGKPFTSFLYPDSLEKPVLYPVHAANGTVVTRGFPLDPKPLDPTDHPHHIGIWFNYENVNGLDFWNNSYAIAKEKKNLYGWIKTDKILSTTSGKQGTLTYHANWTNQKNDVLLHERTRFTFSGTANQRVIDRVTTLTANTDVVFNDSKDGLLGMRLAHELQIPTKEPQKFTDNKGNVTIVAGGSDNIPNGTYLTSEGKQGNDAWSTRGKWCKVYGKMGDDSISIAIIDHPKNVNYPTFWHARGYGLFAANPLGEKALTKMKTTTDVHLTKGQSITFRYRIVVQNGKTTITPKEANALAAQFAVATPSTKKKK
jgi:hypothetical protein